VRSRWEFEADPDNALVWRVSKRRLNAEAIRDASAWSTAAQPCVGVRAGAQCGPLGAGKHGAERLTA
jgi:hypothetical protein